ncbi:hypothetical protein [Halobacillus seohaensis]|uniref:Uncharacterized protein n=1 Tax=Halobacillus seohaensis TaxID=447421 RepID=A0ABW2EFB9_9BACI
MAVKSVSEVKNMGNEIASLISAGIGGMVALIVLGVNQLMQHKRWKENLQRKGEDKYLDKKIDILHETNVELFQLANYALTLARAAENKGVNSIRCEYKKLDSNVRGTIALSSPYLESVDNEKVNSLYETLTVTRLIFNEEIHGTEAEIITHLYWLNEGIWEFRENLSITMKAFYNRHEKSNSWLWITSVSVLLNILLLIYILM